MIILLHSSKTMTVAPFGGVVFREPELILRAGRLGRYLQTLSAGELGKCMHLSAALAKKTYELVQLWSADGAGLALDSFIGDIYSGLRAGELSRKDRDYADKVLRILSGLYGVIRPYDAICPYRLEMGYKLPDSEFANLYRFWGDAIARTLPAKSLIVNLSSEEFSRVITDYVDAERVVAPQFFTVKNGKPTFVVVHAKIARGAFARWLIMSRATRVEEFDGFEDLGYKFAPKLSTPGAPAYVCKEFGGKGLSIK